MQRSFQRRLPVAALLLVLLFTLSACRSAATPTPTPEPAEKLGEAVSALSLIGSTWRAVAFGSPGDSLPVDQAAPLTLNFGPERYGGSGGCNWFLGVYDVQGESMSLMAPAVTALQCTEPADVMDQEAMYLSSLWNIVEYRKDGDKLLAYTSEDQLLLTFVPAEPIDFEGTLWSLKFQMNGDMMAPLISGTEITAQFASGRISGSAGCNTYEAAYTLDGEKFSISDLTSTEMSCSDPEGIMDQEQLYLSNLSAAARLVQVVGLLELIDADGEPLLAFGAAPP